MEQSKAYQQHYGRIERYVAELKRLYAQALDAYAELALHSDLPEGEAFRFDDFPELKERVEEVTRKLARELYANIETANKVEWEKSADISRKYVESALPSILGVKLSEIEPSTLSKLLGRSPAYQSYQESVAKHGLSLSSRVWQLADDFKSDVELAMTAKLGEALQQGMSAASLSRSIRSLLNDPTALFRRVRDKNGKLQLSKRAKAYIAGEGRYRSAYKNAMRLARTTINSAYRTAEQTQMRQVPIVVGKEVHRSTTPYPCEVCERLKGRYPMDFDFGSGWHPQCRCYVTWIMATPEEVAQWMKDGKDFISKNTVTDVPEAFKEFCRENRDKMEGAIGRGTQPFWVRDNMGYIEDAWSGMPSASAGVEGKDLLPGIREHLGGLGKSLMDMVYGGDYRTAQGYFGEMQGFDGLPNLVDEISPDDIKVYRGVSGISQEESDRFAEDFRTGKLFAGEGVHGNGTYTSVSEEIAWDYAGRSHGAVITMGLPKTMRFIEESELEAMQHEYSRQVKGEMTKALTTYGYSSPEAKVLRSLEFAVDELGSFGTLLGYDGIKCKYGHQDCYVIFNRTKVNVLKK